MRKILLAAFCVIVLSALFTLDTSKFGRTWIVDTAMNDEKVAISVQRGATTSMAVYDIASVKTLAFKIDGWELIAPIFLENDKSLYLTAWPGGRYESVESVPNSLFLKCQIDVLNCEKLFEFRGAVTAALKVENGYLFAGSKPVPVGKYGLGDFYHWNAGRFRKLTNFQAVKIDNFSERNGDLYFAMYASRFNNVGKKLQEKIGDFGKKVFEIPLTTILNGNLKDEVFISGMKRSGALDDTGISISTDARYQAYSSWVSPRNERHLGHPESGNHVLITETFGEVLKDIPRKFRGDGSIPHITKGNGLYILDVDRNSSDEHPNEVVTLTVFENMLSEKRVSHEFDVNEVDEMRTIRLD